MTKYPQAISISTVEAWTYVLGNALWDVIFSDQSYGTFFTSDFPIAFGQSYDARVVSKTVPLAPDIAICIHPQVRERKAQSDFSFPNFRARFRRLSRAELHETNQNLVRSAETLVFYNQNADWLMSFVRKNRDYRADAVVSMNPTTTGKMIIARQAVVPFGRPKLS